MRKLSESGGDIGFGSLAAIFKKYQCVKRVQLQRVFQVVALTLRGVVMDDTCKMSNLMSRIRLREGFSPR